MVARANAMYTRLPPRPDPIAGRTLVVALLRSPSPLAFGIPKIIRQHSLKTRPSLFHHLAPTGVQSSCPPCPQHNHWRHSPTYLPLIFDLEICINYTARRVAVPVTVACHQLRYRGDHVL